MSNSWIEVRYQYADNSGEHIKGQKGSQSIGKKQTANFHYEDDISGGAGADTLVGRGENDTLYGGHGNDVLYGGSKTTDPDSDNGYSFKTKNGKMKRDAGDDFLFGQYGHDTLYGGAGQDTLYGGHGYDLMYGGNGNDEMHGGDGNDTMFGQSGNDLLTGGDGHDLLIGEEGDDTLTGGSGSDTLYGGGGSDIFRLNLNDTNIDTILNLTDEDQIEIYDDTRFIASTASTTLSSGTFFIMERLDGSRVLTYNSQDVAILDSAPENLDWNNLF